MRPLALAALTALAACLSACTSEPVAAPRVASAPPPPVAQPQVAPASFETMRVALPAFDLRKNSTGPAPHRDVSVVRDFAFPAESSILSREQVDFLVPLQAYLRVNPGVSVRIEGYGDGRASAEQEIDLSYSRAQAIARALLTDMKIFNTISAVAAAMPQPRPARGTAEITFVTP